MKKLKLYTPVDLLKTNQRYIIDGETYIAVTAALGMIHKRALMFWYAKYGREKCQELSTESSTRGALLHKIIELTLKKKPINLQHYTDDIKDRYNQFKIWKGKRKLQDNRSEATLFSKKWRYAGTADLLSTIDDNRQIVDFKTSEQIYDEMFLQLSAYMMAFYEMTSEQPSGAILLLHPDKYEYHEISFSDVKKIHKYFLNALRLFPWQTDKKWKKHITVETNAP